MKKWYAKDGTPMGMPKPPIGWPPWEKVNTKKRVVYWVSYITFKVKLFIWRLK
jgi:hypothetical protein